MKNTIVLFACFKVLLATNPVQAQQKTGIPKYGELISDTLTNKGTAPATFYFQYCESNGNSKCNEAVLDIFKSDSVFTAWLLKQADAKNPDERRLQYAVALARVMKNTLGGTNGTANLKGEKQTEARAVLSSPVVAFLSNGLPQSIDFFLNTLVGLQKLDTVCAEGNFRKASYTYYQLAEIKYKGDWVAIDAHAESHALLFQKNNGGYYAAVDLSTDTAVIMPALQKYAYRYENGAGESLAAWSDVPGNFPLFFMGGKCETSPVVYTPWVPVSGEVIMPAGASLVFSYLNDAINIDTSTVKGKKVFAELLQLYAKYNLKEDESIMKKIVRLLAAYESISEEQADIAANSGKVLVQGGKSGLVFSRSFTQAPFHAVVEMVLPPHKERLVLGVDVSAPFLWLEDKKSLWQAGEPREVDAADVKLFNKGELKPSAATQHYTLAVNTNVINQFNGFNIKPAKNADKLVITRATLK